MTNKTQPETPAGRPLGDTGDGNTGVPPNEQGISNRPGDRGERSRGEGSPAVDSGAVSDNEDDGDETFGEEQGDAE